jgi:hypothetical protein
MEVTSQVAIEKTQTIIQVLEGKMFSFYQEPDTLYYLLEIDDELHILKPVDPREITELKVE